MRSLQSLLYAVKERTRCIVCASDQHRRRHVGFDNLALDLLERLCRHTEFNFDLRVFGAWREAAGKIRLLACVPNPNKELAEGELSTRRKSLSFGAKTKEEMSMAQEERSSQRPMEQKPVPTRRANT